MGLEIAGTGFKIKLWIPLSFYTEHKHTQTENQTSSWKCWVALEKTRWSGEVRNVGVCINTALGALLRAGGFQRWCTAVSEKQDLESASGDQLLPLRWWLCSFGHGPAALGGGERAQTVLALGEWVVRGAACGWRTTETHFTTWWNKMCFLRVQALKLYFTGERKLGGCWEKTSSGEERSHSWERACSSPDPDSPWLKNRGVREYKLHRALFCAVCDFSCEMAILQTNLMFHVLCAITLFLGSKVSEIVSIKLLTKGPCSVPCPKAVSRNEVTFQTPWQECKDFPMELPCPGITEGRWAIFSYAHDNSCIAK